MDVVIAHSSEELSFTGTEHSEQLNNYLPILYPALMQAPKCLYLLTA